MFQDSAGTTPVTAVEQPVGLILDKRLGLVLGPEIITNGTFDDADDWTLTAEGAISGGALNANVPSGDIPFAITSMNGAAPIGTLVWMEFDLTVVSGTCWAFAGGLSVANALSGGPFATSGRISGLVIVNASGYTDQVMFRSGGGFVGAIDNISVRGIPGNHATQPTAAARPVVSARKNLLERSEEFDNAYWAKDTVTIVANAATAPDGTASADLAYPTSTGVYRYLFKGVGSAANVGDSLTYSVCVKSAGQRWVAILSPGSGGNGGAFVDLQNGVFGEIHADVTATIQSLGDGWYKCCLTQLAVASTVYAGVTLTDADGSYTVTASGTDGVYLWGAQLEISPTATRYQRVTTDSDYDTVGFPHYLAFDGVDDMLIVSSLSPYMDNDAAWFTVTAAEKGATSSGFPTIMRKRQVLSPLMDTSIALYNATNRVTTDRFVADTLCYAEALPLYQWTSGARLVISGGYDGAAVTSRIGIGATASTAASGSLGTGEELPFEIGRALQGRIFGFIHVIGTPSSIGKDAAVRYVASGAGVTL